MEISLEHLNREADPPDQVCQTLQTPQLIGGERLRTVAMESFVYPMFRSSPSEAELEK
jgi:hypothetical protein